MPYKIEEIEGVGPAFAQKLTTVKIGSTDDLLEKCSTSKGRKEVSEKTDISESMLLKWANHADMMRISGVGPQFAELLEASGVDTVKELRTRNADNLATALGQHNEQKKLAKTSPAATVVQGWIDQAKKMDPRITH